MGADSATWPGVFPHRRHILGGLIREVRKSSVPRQHPPISPMGGRSRRCWCGIGVWCGIRSGFLDLKQAEGKRLLAMIVGGFFAMLALACLFTFWLPFLPREVAP